MPLDRDAEDHVYCMFEFPGPEYSKTFDVGYYDRVENYPASVRNDKTQADGTRRTAARLRYRSEQEGGRHLFVDQRQRLRWLGRSRLGQQGNA